MNDPQLERRLGPYRLLRVVGRGGMGTVYAATDETTGLTAAVKILAPNLASDTSFRERFSAEIESLKKLKHPNIVQLYGYGEQDGQLYYAMELIEGSSLQEELRRGRRFTWRDVSRIAVDVCAALKHAHDHGIIHRDLKPANLLYTQDDRVKLLDFGIAKLFGNTGVTTGSVLGTADYMAPEQAEGKAVGPRTDLYSLGSVMYALLAGRPPFVGKSVPEVVHKVRFEPPVPVSRLAADVPVELDQLIEQLLEKQPRKRVPTALATSHRLRAMEHALSVQREASDLPVDGPIPAGGQPHRAEKESNPHELETAKLEERHADRLAAQRLTVVSYDEPGLTGPDHYTVVDQPRDASAERGLFVQNVLLALLLIAVLWGGYQAVRWAARPPGADELYEQIARCANPADPGELAQVERPIGQFLTHYADDPRASDVAGWQKELELHRMQRRLEDRRLRDAIRPDSAVAAAYLNIVPLLDLDPQLAAEQLEALLALYAATDGLDAEQRQYLDLAKLQQRRLQARWVQEAELALPAIELRIAQARQQAAENPDQARRIYEGLIRLYEDKDWAAELVQTARSDLEHLSSGEMPQP